MRWPASEILSAMSHRGFLRHPLLTSLFLVTATLGVYWQVVHHDYISYDDPEYVADNIIVQQGFTSRSITWAFTTALGNGSWPTALQRGLAKSSSSVMRSARTSLFLICQSLSGECSARSLDKYVFSLLRERFLHQSWHGHQIAKSAILSMHRSSGLPGFPSFWWHMNM